MVGVDHCDFARVPLDEKFVEDGLEGGVTVPK